MRHAGPRVGAAQDFGPAAVVTRRAAGRLRAGHLWVYESDVEALIPLTGTLGVEAGALVTVTDGRGIPLGSALYSDASQIALRLVSSRAGLTRAEYLVEAGKRVGAALALRGELAPSSSDDNACRLIFSEADGLPGIVADRYNDLVVLQLLTQGTAKDDVRVAVMEALVVGLGEGISVWERPDARVRELERLSAPEEGALYGGREAKTATVFSINGLRFNFNAGSGQKTGAFLDQRLNYAAAARYGRGVGLDVCTYQGGFALHLAQVCERVTGVDTSRGALEVADRNRELNPQLKAEVDWIEADAFELLRAYEDSSREYDTIVLDPPAFAKSKRAAEGDARIQGG